MAAPTGSDCADIDRDFIIGRYDSCKKLEHPGTLSLRCRYLKTLCKIAERSYDDARYELSIISADMSAASKAPSELNALALTSLAELAFLQGDYPRGRNLTRSVNTLLDGKLQDSYPHSVSELLMLKSYFDSREIDNARNILRRFSQRGMDTMLYNAMNPWN